MEHERSINDPSLEIQHKRESLGLSYTEFATLLDLKNKIIRMNGKAEDRIK